MLAQYQTPPETKTKTVCHHCGDPCDKELIVANDHNFCCRGCEMVFGLLHDNGLGQFYKLENKPGINLKDATPGRYDWLEDDEIFAQLIDYQDDEIVKVRLEIPQIYCTACVYLLENLHKLHPGINRTQVQFLKKELLIVYRKADTNLLSIVQLLEKLGYAPSIQFSHLEAAKEAPVDSTLVYQIGVAGFCFGNIMLLAFPEYLGLESATFQEWFRWLSVALAIPVLFYSGRHYLQAAWRGLQHRQLTIDVPIAIGMVVLFGRSLHEILLQTGGGYLDSLAGLVFFLLVGKWFQQKTYNRLSFDRDYKSYFPIAATVALGNNKLQSVPINKLKPGDELLIRHGELIPADAILMDGRAQVDYSFVTGEADLKRIQPKEKVYAGGRQSGSSIRILLQKNVSQSYLTQLWNEDNYEDNKISEVAALTDRVSKYFTPAILLIAFGTLFYWIGKDVSLAFNAFTAVLIIACPCAIALTAPFTLGNALRLLGKNDFYLKNTSVIEHFPHLTAIIFDKTGTLTKTESRLLQYEGRPLTESEKSAIKSITLQSSHPISRLICEWLGDISMKKVEQFSEKSGIGVSGIVENLSITIQKGTEGNPGTHIIINDEFVGVFRFLNEYREGWEQLLTEWGSAYRLYLLSGDNDREKERLAAYIPEENLHFNQTPQDKLAFVKKLQQNGETVMMFGDGLNDSGALRQSDIGIVISEDINNFTPASDAVLKGQKFSHLPKLLRYIKNTISVVFMGYGLALIYNIIGLSFAVQGELSPVIAAILMPLSSITIVAFGTGMTQWLGSGQG